MDEHLVSLLQTVIWAGVALYFGIRFRFGIEGIFQSIKKRIDDGSGIKSPFIELSETPKATASEIQAEKLSEAKELLTPPIDDTAIDNSQSTEPAKQEIIEFGDLSKYLDRYLLVEKLALDSLAARFNVEIFRERRFGSDWLVDGAFTSEGSLFIVEVKLFSRAISHNQLRKMLLKAESNIQKRGWRNVKYIFVAVIDEGSNATQQNIFSTWEKVSREIFPEQREAKIEIMQFNELFENWFKQR